MDKQRFPRIRFDGFLGDWEGKTLADVSIVERGKFSARPRNDPKFFGGSMPFIQTGDITNSELFLTNYTQTLNPDGILVSKVFPQKTILITIAANIGDTAITTFDIACPDSVVAIQADENQSNVFFLKYILDLKHAFLNDCATQNAQKNINLQVLNPLEIKLCSLSEQTHLGNFFRRLDSQIAESRAVLEKSCQLKKAMLAKMFPANGEKIPKIRFKGFEGEWREWKLGAFGNATSGTSLESEFCEDGNYKVISIGSYSEKSTYTDQGIRTHKNDKTEKRILNKNDLTMILNDKTSSGRIIGRVLLIDQNDTYVYNQRTQRIEIDQEHFIPLFLYHLLNAENMRQKIIYSAQGNTQIYVNWSGIKNLEYLIPPTKAEQTAIGNFFRQLDETIALQSAEVEKLNQLKKGLLAAMLM